MVIYLYMIIILTAPVPESVSVPYQEHGGFGWEGGGEGSVQTNGCLLSHMVWCLFLFTCLLN